MTIANKRMQLNIFGRNAICSQADASKLQFISKQKLAGEFCCSTPTQRNE
jgi:hypothetical protein